MANTPATTSDYGFAAQEKERERKGYIRKITVGTIVFVVVTIAVLLLDITLFDGPITRANHNSDPTTNAILLFFCGALPLVTAMLAAHFLRRCFYEESRSAGTICLAILCIAATAGLLYASWWVRSELYVEEDANVGFLLNVVAVASALCAFVAHWIYERSLERWQTFAKEAAAERDVLSILDYRQKFNTTSEQDSDRRKADDSAYAEALNGMNAEGITLMHAARERLACKIANSPEERDHIINTPLRVGRVYVGGDTVSEIHQSTGTALGIPTADEARQDWGAATNTYYFDEAKREIFDEYARRLSSIQGKNRDKESQGSRGSHGGKESDGNPRSPEVLEVFPVAS